MRPAPLSPVASRLLQQPNPAVVGLSRPDGSPFSTATWYLLDGDEILVNAQSNRPRIGYLRRDPRVTLTVLAASDWYTHVTISGRVVDIHDDPDLTDIDRIARHYTGDRFVDRDTPRSTARIAIERWHAHDLDETPAADAEQQAATAPGAV